MSYSIGEVAALTGVSPMTLRAWESRYDVVRPQRTASAYRQYDDREVAVLQRMQALIASGVSPRRAAGLAAGAAVSRPDSPAALPALQDRTALARAGAVLDGDALRRILDEAFAVASIETAVDDWLVPSMHEVGRAWESGELDVVAEHFISAAVMRKLSALFEATPAHGPRVAVGLPSEARHELPALAFALLLQRTGAEVLYVGADIPQSCWSRLAETWQPQAAVLGVAADQDVAPAAAAVEVLTGAGVAPVYVGGRAARQVSHAIPLTASLSEAARTVAAALAHGRPMRPTVRHRRSAPVG